jgi:hypothetical protein
VENPDEAAIQLGQYGVTVDQDSEIRIGEKINYKNLDRDSIDALVSAIKNANDATNGRVFKHLKRQPLEPLKKLDYDQIERINSDLELIDSLDKKGYLGAPQLDAFTALKQEIHSLNEYSKKLEELHFVAKALLEEGRINLMDKIELLKIEGKKILDSEILAQLAQERKCKENELKALENFIQELEEAGRISAWIDKRRKAISKRFGREALKEFPDIESTIDPDRVSYFFFSIDQFLEQVVHCLKWGRYDILDSPDIPLVLDCRAYERAFSLIKEAIEKDLPARFNQASRKLANDCIDYLIAQLPFYEEEE